MDGLSLYLDRRALRRASTFICASYLFSLSHVRGLSEEPHLQLAGALTVDAMREFPNNTGIRMGVRRGESSGVSCGIFPRPRRILKYAFQVNASCVYKMRETWNFLVDVFGLYDRKKRPRAQTINVEVRYLAARWGGTGRVERESI